MQNGAKFVPFPFLSNRHLMTILPALLPRYSERLRRTAQSRLFAVQPRSKILGHCHLQEDRHACPTLVVVHGLEGSSNSAYVVGLSDKALAASMNVVRLNMRNCGDTLHLTPTLYNAGLSDDVIAVVTELMERDGCQSIFLIGYSLGGNVVLKAAAELGDAAKDLLAGVCAISPSLDLLACVNALQSGFNRLYEQRFLISLKQKVLDKGAIFPGSFDTSKLPSINSLLAFDDTYTAPDGGYQSALDYYNKASALNMVHRIAIPTLIIAAKDDPIVPFSAFLSPVMNNPNLHFLTPDHGGHGGFLNAQVEESRSGKTLDRFWAENRIIDFCLQRATIHTIASCDACRAYRK